jgi:ribosomal protein L31
MITELSKLRELLSSTIVEVEVAIDTATHPDWTETKENLLKAIDIVRKLERDQMWSKLSKKK